MKYVNLSQQAWWVGGVSMATAICDTRVPLAVGHGGLTGQVEGVGTPLVVAEVADVEGVHVLARPEGVHQPVDADSPGAKSGAGDTDLGVAGRADRLHPEVAPSLWVQSDRACDAIEDTLPVCSSHIRDELIRTHWRHHGVTGP